MRFLGVCPSDRPDDLEATLMVALSNRIVAEHERMARDAQ